MRWLSENTHAIQALAAILTAIIALGALIGVKIQLDETERLQKLQSARDAYRAHLALAVSNPDFAAPKDYCALRETPKKESYHAFVDHLLYSADQMLDSEEGWEDTFFSILKPHAVYLCSESEQSGASSEITYLFGKLKSEGYCEKVETCD